MCTLYFGQVHRGQGDAPTGIKDVREGARSGAPVDADQHEQPSSGATQPGQVRRGRGNAPTGAGAEGEGADQKHPSTIGSMNNLALVLRSRASTRKPGQCFMLNNINNVALVLHSQSKY
jgi:hypothetical protein